MERFERLASADRCNVCDHPTRIHSLSVLGKTLCTGCASGECTHLDAQIKETPASVGILFIGQMSKTDLVEEILSAQRTALMGESVDQLKAFVVQLRAKRYHESLRAEAGLTSHEWWETE